MSLIKVKTRYGEIQGVEKSGYTLFRGVPYAKPPIGELRFEAPQKPESWHGCRLADHWPNRAMQGAQKEGFYGKEFYSNPKFYTDACSEDCLYLNIWTPAKSANEKLPVAVWIHGGAFYSGFSWELELHGEESKAILQSGGYKGSLCVDLPLSDAEKLGEKLGMLVQCRTIEEMP